MNAMADVRYINQGIKFTNIIKFHTIHKHVLTNY